MEGAHPWQRVLICPVAGILVPVCGEAVLIAEDRRVCARADSQAWRLGGQYGGTRVAVFVGIKAY